MSEDRWGALLLSLRAQGQAADDAIDEALTQERRASVAALDAISVMRDQLLAAEARAEKAEATMAAMREAGDALIAALFHEAGYFCGAGEACTETVCVLERAWDAVRGER